MIAEAFVYAIVVTALIGAAAASAESALAALGRPRRLAWLAAYAVAVVFPLAALLAADAPATDAAAHDVRRGGRCFVAHGLGRAAPKALGRGHGTHAAHLRHRLDSPRDPRQGLAARGGRQSAGRARGRRRARSARRFQAAHRSAALARRWPGSCPEHGRGSRARAHSRSRPSLHRGRSARHGAAALESAALVVRAAATRGHRGRLRRTRIARRRRPRALRRRATRGRAAWFVIALPRRNAHRARDATRTEDPRHAHTTKTRCRAARGGGRRFGSGNHRVCNEGRAAGSRDGLGAIRRRSRGERLRQFFDGVSTTVLGQDAEARAIRRDGQDGLVFEGNVVFEFDGTSITATRAVAKEGADGRMTLTLEDAVLTTGPSDAGTDNQPKRTESSR